VQLVGVPLLIVFHFIAFLWNNFAVPFLILIIAYFFRQSIINFASAALSFPAVGLISQYIINGIVNLIIAIVLITQFRKITRYRFGKIKIPMIQ